MYLEYQVWSGRWDESALWKTAACSLPSCQVVINHHTICIYIVLNRHVTVLALRCACHGRLEASKWFRKPERLPAPAPVLCMQTISEELHESQHLEIPNPRKKKWGSDLEPSNRADDNYEEKTGKEKKEASQHPPPQTIAAGVYMKLHLCVCVCVCVFQREKEPVRVQVQVHDVWVSTCVWVCMHAVRMRMHACSQIFCFPSLLFLDPFSCAQARHWATACHASN